MTGALGKFLSKYGQKGMEYGKKGLEKGKDLADDAAAMAYGSPAEAGLIGDE